LQLQQIGHEVNEFIRANDLKKKIEMLAGQLEGFEGKLASAGRFVDLMLFIVRKQRSIIIIIFHFV
jgi:hypothetical protein